MQLVADAASVFRPAASSTRRHLRASTQVPAAATPRCVQRVRSTVVCSQQMDRRSALLGPAAGMLVLATSTTGFNVSAAVAADNLPEGTRVVVLGGTGFVGSRVVEALVARGAQVVSISRRGGPGDLASKPWSSKVEWVAGDLTGEDLSGVMKGASAVISCIGVIGGSDEYMLAGNGEANVKAVSEAKAAGVPKFVYVSVASIVADNVDGIALKGYFEGKRQAEAAITAAFPDSSVIVKPSFIYGGDAFVLAPPRVPAGYGSAIEGLLSSGPIKGLAGVSPGLIALTLAPPVSVQSVANAAVAGALGDVPPGKIDGTQAINSVAQ